jgi:protein-S-isoprenylcysteine O-methyltransferase Ste14
VGQAKDIYARQGGSRAPRVALAAALAAGVGMACWLLLGVGMQTTSAWLGIRLGVGDFMRRICLLAAFAIYFVRVLFSAFVFLKRAMAWGEATMIAVWVLFIFVLLSIAGGTDPAPIGAAGFAGTAFFVLGSWMNTYAEYLRHMWKARPEHRGQLFTRGLFRWSRHPNYLGDLTSFSGMCLISGRWFTAAIPLLMLMGFVFVNIPMLDAHLQAHYGRQFDEYAARTRKLIPFIY